MECVVKCCVQRVYIGLKCSKVQHMSLMFELECGGCKLLHDYAPSRFSFWKGQSFMTQGITIALFLRLMYNSF